jgi:NADPH-dependent ferric siderophore reductase
LIRVVLDASGNPEFAPGGYTDHYLKVLFPQPGVAYPHTSDLDTMRQELPREQWPDTRTYTVRSWDPETKELSIDFVYHGDVGLAGPWAAAAQPGDELLFMGPGGGYTPDPAADWHLLAGDESALPAIAASLEHMPEGAKGHAFIEVHDPGEIQKLNFGSAANISTHWLYRGSRQVGDALVEAVQTLAFPDGAVHAFVHGEASMIKRLRRHLRIERGLDMKRVSISGYWRLGHNEDAWQSSKREWNRQVEEDEATALAS